MGRRPDFAPEKSTAASARWTPPHPARASRHQAQPPEANMNRGSRVMIMGKIRAIGGLGRAVCLAAFATGPLSAVAADSPDLLEQRFFVALGSYIVDTNTYVRLDGELDEGTDFDWEKTFARATSRASAWTPSGGSRSGICCAPPGSVLPARTRWCWNRTSNGREPSRRARGCRRINFDVYELAYEYAVLQRDNYEIAASIGVPIRSSNSRCQPRPRRPVARWLQTSPRPATLAHPCR